MDRETSPSKTVTTDPPHAKIVKPDGQALANELAATGLAIFDKEEERREYNSKITGELKKLKKRYREIASEVKNGGVQLAMNWGSRPSDNEPDKPAKRGGRRTRVH